MNRSGNTYPRVRAVRLPTRAAALLRACAFAAVCLTATANAQQAAGQRIRTGDLHLDYLFAPTGERMPYRLYAPTSYDGTRAYPLIVVLHGGGGDQNSDFDATRVRELAEDNDVVVLAPLGYNRFGGYGSAFPIVTTPQAMAAARAMLRPEVTTGDAGPAPRDDDSVPDMGTLPPAAAEPYAEMPAGFIQDAVIGVLSEQDVLLAMEDVMRNYRIDPGRVYLTGNSMGGGGTQHLAAKYPEKWAAVATGGLPVAEWAYPFRRLRDADLPIMYVHGELDNLSNAHWSEVLWRRAMAEGVEAEFVLVENGTHGTGWSLALPDIFAFLLRHRSNNGE
jgi:poly(3-hydroxybutyrate) depolymerase